MKIETIEKIQKDSDLSRFLKSSFSLNKYKPTINEYKTNKI